LLIGLHIIYTPDVFKNRSSFSKTPCIFNYFINIWLQKRKDTYLHLQLIYETLIKNINFYITRNYTEEELYNKIKLKYENNTLLEAFFVSQKNKFNGYLQKADVYGLGACIYESIIEYKVVNPSYQIDLLN
jgi:hypothetical protein